MPKLFLREPFPFDDMRGRPPRRDRLPGAALVAGAALATFALGWALVAVGSTPSASAASAPVSPGRITATRPTPPAMITVNAGWFRMGSTPKAVRAALARFGSLEGRGKLRKRLLLFLQEEIPQRRMHLSAYRIDRLEVTRGEYARCVKAGRCSAVPAPSKLGAFSRSDAPMVNVTWKQAAAYCRWVGKRLPTEAQWEKAARGPFGRIWPWGARWHERRCNHGALHPVLPRFHGSAADGFYWVAPAGSFPFDRSYYGVMDLGGNVAEWVADWYAPGWWRQGKAPRHDPRGPKTGRGRLIKGGSWSRLRLLSRPTAKRILLPSQQRSPDVGFRCARSATPR